MSDYEMDGINILCECGHPDRRHADRDDGSKYGAWGVGECELCGCKVFVPKNKNKTIQELQATISEQAKTIEELKEENIRFKIYEKNVKGILDADLKKLHKQTKDIADLKSQLTNQPKLNRDEVGDILAVMLDNVVTESGYYFKNDELNKAITAICNLAYDKDRIEMILKKYYGYRKNEACANEIIGGK